MLTCWRGTSPAATMSSKLPLWSLLVVLTIFICGNSLVMSVPVKSDYLKKRAALLKKDHSTGLGHGLQLNDKEKILSEYLLKEKKKMIEAAREGKDIFMPALSFFESKPQMEKSPIFQIIKKMPKGAALHVHDLAITSIDWLVKTLTYRDHVYMCITPDNSVILTYQEKPAPTSDCSTWKLVKEERAKARYVEEFDESIRRNISMLTTDPLKTYQDVNKVWVRFNMYFRQIYQLLMTSMAMGDYYGQALKEFYEDNVQYIELRGQMFGLADLDGTLHDAEFGLNIYKKVTSEFVKSHPDFHGAKFIMSSLRILDQSTMEKQLKTALDLHKRYPDIFLGYDLVGQEDNNKPLYFYLDELLYPSEETPAVKLPYFFHAGETNWQNTQVDYNLADALLLNTTRIGHGYALPKHPALIEKAKEDGVAVEVNPISNQLLHLVADLRNHAMVPLMADNFPVVISSDDPGVWEAAPLSHDFFLAFMNMCGEDAGLEALKQLAINSIEYSALNTQEKSKLMALWQTKWNKFINDSVDSLPNVGSKIMTSVSFVCIISMAICYLSYITTAA